MKLISKENLKLKINPKNNFTYHHSFQKYLLQPNLPSRSKSKYPQKRVANSTSRYPQTPKKSPKPSFFPINNNFRLSLTLRSRNFNNFCRKKFSMRLINKNNYSICKKVKTIKLINKNYSLASKQLRTIKLIKKNNILICKNVKTTELIKKNNFSICKDVRKALKSIRK
jgi:hypothetical protein